jgi:NADH-quinone oxidoreductase subunit C
MLNEKLTFLEEVQAQNGDSWFIVTADRLLEASKILRDELGLDCLSCLTGTDKGLEIEVVYHLFSYKTNVSVILKVLLRKAIPDGLKVPSVSEVWPSANWMEREIFDLLGINFPGHPNLKRIMLPDDWEGHPLRKDYVERAEYAGMSTAR